VKITGGEASYGDRNVLEIWGNSVRVSIFQKIDEEWEEKKKNEDKILQKGKNENAQVEKRSGAPRSWGKKKLRNGKRISFRCGITVERLYGGRGGRRGHKGRDTNGPTGAVLNRRKKAQSVKKK